MVSFQAGRGDAVVLKALVLANIVIPLNIRTLPYRRRLVLSSEMLFIVTRGVHATMQRSGTDRALFRINIEDGVTARQRFDQT